MTSSKRLLFVNLTFLLSACGVLFYLWFPRLRSISLDAFTSAGSDTFWVILDDLVLLFSVVTALTLLLAAYFLFSEKIKRAKITTYFTVFLAFLIIFSRMFIRFFYVQDINVIFRDFAGTFFGFYLGPNISLVDQLVFRFTYILPWLLPILCAVPITFQKNQPKKEVTAAQIQM